MRIALMSTCAVTTPPADYGGTELVVADLAHALDHLGHDVTVYATADSRPGVRCRGLFPHPVWPPSDLSELRHVAHAWSDIRRERPDVVHVNHATALPFAGLIGTPCIATLHHERVPELVTHYASYPDLAYVAISGRQAELSPELDFRRVIHHGLDVERYPEGRGGGGYLAFLGRFAPEKGTHLAIDAAVKAGVPLWLGGAPHEVAREYHEREVRPRLLRHADRVRHLGPVAQGPKAGLLGDALALLFPSTWEEPFGLVMIEAMLCGTPVIALDRGSAPEVIDDGVTGFLVSDAEEMAARIRDVRGLDRRGCRRHAIRRFSSLRMARDYLDLYAEMARRMPRRQRATVPPRRYQGARP